MKSNKENAGLPVLAVPVGAGVVPHGPQGPANPNYSVVHSLSFPPTETRLPLRDPLCYCYEVADECCLAKPVSF